MGSHDSDPGDVKFGGVKVSDHSPHDGMNIQSEWGSLDQRAYDQENRARWKRRGERGPGSSKCRHGRFVYC